MRLRLFVLFSVMVLVLTCGAVSAAKNDATQVEQKPLEVAVYPGGAIEREINLTDETLLESIKTGLTAFTVSAPKEADGDFSAFMSALDLGTLSSAISGVKRIRIIQYRLASAKVPNEISKFYDKELAKGGWTRVIWDASSPDKVSALYSLPAGVGLFAVQAQLVRPKAGSAKTSVWTGRTEGMVDVPKLMGWLGKVFTTLEKATHKPATAATEPEKTDNPPL